VGRLRIFSYRSIDTDEFSALEASS